MPYKPLRPCAYPGCRELVSNVYCNKHQKQKDEDNKARSNSYNKNRPEYHKLYGRKWREYRERYLAQHPYCVECLKAGIHTLATEVDHIKPHKGDSKKFWNKTNHQGLCKGCHSKKTAKENGGFGNTPAL